MLYEMMSYFIYKCICIHVLGCPVKGTFYCGFFKKQFEIRSTDGSYLAMDLMSHTLHLNLASQSVCSKLLSAVRGSTYTLISPIWDSEYSSTLFFFRSAIFFQAKRHKAVCHVHFLIARKVELFMELVAIWASYSLIYLFSSFVYFCMLLSFPSWLIGV